MDQNNDRKSFFPETEEKGSSQEELKDNFAPETSLPNEDREPEPSREETLTKEIDHLKDQLLRNLAELENVRKRAQKEKDETRQYAITKFAQDLLTVADNLGRTLQGVRQGAEETSGPFKSFVEGVEMTLKELDAVFTRQGIQKVSSLGQKFDPNVHQAMFETETLDLDKIGTVDQVLQDGYLLNGRLLRPAMVGVFKAAPKKDL